MYLRSFFVFLLSISVLCGCASKPVNEQDLFQTLSIGVQVNNAVTQKATEILFPSDPFLRDEVPFSIEFLPVRELKKELMLGNYDIVISASNTIEYDSQVTNWKSFPIEELSLHYLALTERKNLINTYDKHVFFSKVKSVGYIPPGIQLGINSNLLSSHAYSDSFIDCRSVNQCLDMLSSRKIDALCISGIHIDDSISHVLTTYSLDVSEVQFFELGEFSIGLNSRSLTLKERGVLERALKKLFNDRISTSLINADNNTNA
ncbi:hypothetical protein [Microbulbifer variabilis]|uniref:hypothetical protein n=1 Tax=Microbulbifer variabilis TaxID=266805 RepID=UPI001CFC6367|nr:hypothetical protein [Microbulbifer variabilis]